MNSLVYLGFMDGAICHTRNMASVAWVIYSPEGELVSSGGVCLEPSTSNVVEYSIVIEILCNSISHGVQYLYIHLDSHLVICQLKGSYCV
jgi:ribonuclease HI